MSDFNFPKLSWGSEHAATIRPGPCIQTLPFLLDDFGLVLMESGPIRGVNILDLFLTSNHTLVNIN